MHLNYIILGMLFFWIIFFIGIIQQIRQHYSQIIPKLKSIDAVHNANKDLRVHIKIHLTAILVLCLLVVYVLIDVNNWYFDETWLKGFTIMLVFILVGLWVNKMFKIFVNIFK